MDRLSQLRAFAQSNKNAPAPIGYPQLPLQQPPDFSSWPWIKQKKLFDEYLRFDRDAPLTNIMMDYSPLLWCPQARIEALKFFCEENHLIRISVFAKKGENLRKERILNPVNQLCVPIELFDEEMLATLEKGVTLHIQFGEGCGKEQPTKAQNCVYDKIFIYSKHSWPEYCQILATNTVRTYPGMTINLHPRYRTNFRDLIPDFLLHLSHFRFAENVHVVEMMSNPFFSALASMMMTHPVNPWDWHNLLLGLIEEAGVRAQTDFNAGYVFMCRAFSIAEMALCCSLWLIDEPGQRPFTNGTLALCTKVFIIHTWVLHLIIENKVVHGQYPAGVWFVLEKMYMTIRNARTWPGMSDRQQAGALFVSGLFYEHLAGYLATPGNLELVQNKPTFNHGADVVGHYKHAAHSFFAAAQINPAKFSEPAMKRWNTIYQKFGTGVAEEVFQVKMEMLSTLKGGTWFGWKVLWDAWGIDKLACLEIMREKQVMISSKSQVKKVREKLGLGNCRKEPAGLLRCLAKVEMSYQLEAS